MTNRFRRISGSRLTTGYLAAALASAAVVLAAVMPSPAEAASAQSRRTDVVKQLGAQFDETQAAVGVTSNGRVIEVFATADGSTWTLVLTRPNGTSQVIAVGETWIKR